MSFRIVVKPFLFPLRQICLSLMHGLSFFLFTHWNKWKKNFFKFPIFNQIKAKIESGEIKDNVIDFLNKIKAAVDAKIAAATPAVKAILEKVDAAVKDIIAKAKGHVERPGS